MNRKIALILKSPKNRKKIIICIIAAALIGVASYYLCFQQETVTPEVDGQLSSSEENVESEISSGSIYVDISGAVNEPSVILLAEGSRVFEAIEAAGGLTEDANLTNINRAEVLEDGMLLYIPTDKEMESEPAVTSGNAGGAASNAVQDKININTADSTTLQQLNGVGPATAGKIIDYRTNTGKFKKIEDIKNVSGIGDKTFEKLSPHIKI